MQKIISFGCSITHGQYLVDSSDAWPVQLGNILDKTPDNQGIPGASNLQILHNILNYDFSSTDTVVVMWSNPDRDYIYTPTGAVQMGSWQNSEQAKYWMLTHSEYDLGIRGWLCMHHAKLFFESKKIPYYFFSIDQEYCLSYKPEWIDVSILPLEVQKIRKVDYATDNRHPGPRGHRILAQEISKFIC